MSGPGIKTGGPVSRSSRSPGHLDKSDLEDRIWLQELGREHLLYMVSVKNPGISGQERKKEPWVFEAAESI